MSASILDLPPEVLNLIPLNAIDNAHFRATCTRTRYCIDDLGKIYRDKSIDDVYKIAKNVNDQVVMDYAIKNGAKYHIAFDYLKELAQSITEAYNLEIIRHILLNHRNQ